MALDRYKRRTVRAVRFVPANGAQITEALAARGLDFELLDMGGSVTSTMSEVTTVRILNNETPVLLVPRGDWVLVRDDGSFEVQRHEDFTSEWEPV